MSSYKARTGGARGRTRILEAALSLITKRGSGDVTMGEIPKAARVSRPAVYLHFADRAELLVALVRPRRTPLDHSGVQVAADNRMSLPGASVRANQPADRVPIIHVTKTTTVGSDISTWVRQPSPREEAFHVVPGLGKTPIPAAR